MSADLVTGVSAGGAVGLRRPREGLADQRDAGAVGEVEVGRGVEDGEVGAGADAEVADVGAAERRGAAGGRGRTAPRPGSSPSPARPARCTAASRRCSRSPGLQSLASATVTPASSSRRRVRVRRAGGELHARQQASPTCRLSASASTSASVEVGAVVDGGQRRARRPAARPGPGRAGWRAAGRGGPRPRRPRGSRGPGRRRRRRARRTRRSTARAARTASSIGPVTRSTYAAGSSAYSGGTTCAPRKVVSSVTCRGDREARASSRDGQPVAALDLDRGRALPAHLVDEPGQVRGELLVGGGAGRGDRGADAAGRVRRPGHPGRELLGPVAGEHQVASASRRSRGPPPGRRRRTRVSAAGACRGRTDPGDRGRPRRPARRRAARAAAARGSWVTSSPMPVSARVRHRVHPARDRPRVELAHRHAPVAGRRPRRRRRRATTSDDVGAPSPRRPRSPRRRRCRRCARRPVSRVTRSARAPTAIAAGVGEARASGARRRSRRPAARRPTSARAPGWPAARRARRRASPRTGRSPRGCPSRASAATPASRSARDGPMPSPRSRSVVGQKQARVRLRPSRRDVARRSRWVACTAVVRGPSAPASSSSCGRGAGRRPRGRRRSRRPARTGARAAARRAPAAHCDDRRHLVARARPAPSGSPRRPRRRSPPRSRQAVDPRRPARRRVAVAEPPLHALAARGPMPGGEVAGVEQRDPEPGLARRRHERVRPSRWGRRTACRRRPWCR